MNTLLSIDLKYLLYFNEFTESWVQFNNLVSIYSCTLPIGWNITFILLLIIESSHRTKFMFHKLWGGGQINFKERNFQVILDMAIDLFFFNCAVNYFMVWVQDTNIDYRNFICDLDSIFLVTFKITNRI